MISKSSILFFIFASIIANCQSNSEKILGNWLATDNSVSVKVYKVNNDYRAKILWFDDQRGSKIPMNSQVDDENPNPALRNRKIIGMEILEGLQFDSKQNSWEKGRIYDASSGKSWDSSAKIEKDGTLKVRGFWKFKWIGKSMSFKKIK